MVIKRRDKKGQIRYQVRVGKKSLGTYPTLGEARKAESRHNLGRRVDVALTVNQVLARFVPLYEQGKALRAQSKPPKASTVLSRRSQFRHLKAMFGDTPIDRISTLDAEDFAQAYPSSVTTASLVLNYAVERELITVNRFLPHVPKKGRGRKDLAPLTDAQLELLSEAFTDAWGSRLGAMVPFLAYTGLRSAECYALDWTDIDWQTDEIDVSKNVYKGLDGTPKTGPRKALMLPQARAAIEPFRGITGPVFTTPLRGRRLSSSAMTHTYWWPLVNAASAGVEDGVNLFGREVDIYEMRHFCAHLMFVRMDLPSRIVAAQLGNSPRMIETLYGHYKIGALDQLRAAVSRGVPTEARTNSPIAEADTA